MERNPQTDAQGERETEIERERETDAQGERDSEEGRLQGWLHQASSALFLPFVEALLQPHRCCMEPTNRQLIYYPMTKASKSHLANPSCWWIIPSFEVLSLPNLDQWNKQQIEQK